MGSTIVFLFIMIPCSLLFTFLGIYAWNRREPMWFWSGTSVKSEEISDVPAYNRANGIMWIAFSGIFWLSVIMGFFSPKTAGLVMLAGIPAGGIMLVFAYSRIYEKYRRK
ncbi:MAG: hypothetical protein K6D03_12020 [Solobacterium sp.]|nr:hypothetical protein [Solobacterium sp.]